MKARRALLFALPALAALLLAAVLARQLVADRGGPSVPPSARIGEPLPGFVLPSLLEGEGELRSRDLRGEPFLVNVWAEWCGPCKVEHPRLMELAAEGVAVYGIDYKDRDERARAFLEETGNPFRLVGADRDGRAGFELGIYGVPETFVVDAGGRIRHRHAGPLSVDDLERTIRPLLAALAE